MFGFPKLEHKNYKKNFLKTVLFRIEFDKCLNIDSKEEKIKNLFQDKFPRFNSGIGKGFEIIIDNKNTNFNEVTSGHNINIKSENGQRIIDINQDSISLTIAGKSYVSFDDLADDFQKVTSFFSLCGIDTINKVGIRKINIIEFKNKENRSDILNFLINPTLVSHINDFPNKKYINQSINSINYKDNNNFLNLKYGLNVPNALDDEIGQLIIDIDLIVQKSIEIKDIISEASLINSEIFNIFSWLINDNAKAILNG